MSVLLSLYFDAASRLLLCCHFIHHRISFFLFSSVPHHLPLLKSHYFLSLSLFLFLSLAFAAELRGSRAESAFTFQRGNQNHTGLRHHAELRLRLFLTNPCVNPLDAQRLLSERFGPLCPDTYRPHPGHSSASGRPRLCYRFSGHPLC